jgi:GNAT superfamily N-acetyltransferase
MAPSEPAVVESPLLESDLADADELVGEAGWNQTAADWRIFIELGTVHVIRAGAGRVIATAATLPYADRFAWISMVLVAAACRRRGLASRLLRRCVDDLAAAGLVPVLDATPDGRAVYRGLGFMDAWSFARMARGNRVPPAPAAPADGGRRVDIRPTGDDIWPKLCAYDAAAFGADRTGLLTRLRGRAPGAELCAEHKGRIVGFLLGREGRIARQIGPLVADEDAIADALLVRALGAIEGAVFVDVPDTKAGTQALLAANGFASQRRFTRMLHRRAEAFDDGARTFAVAGPEFG